MHANDRKSIEYVEAGDIAAAVGFKDIKTGDTLCDEAHPIILEAMNFPEPVISIAVEPKTQKIKTNLECLWLNWLKKILLSEYLQTKIPVKPLSVEWVSYTLKSL